MTSLKKILCCFALIATATISQANAWHGHGFGGHGFAGHGYGHGYGGYGFSGHGYGFGLNHQSFYPSIYNPGWSSYSRASFYSSYGYAGLGYGGLGYSGLGYRGLSYGLWPRTSFYYRSYAPIYYTPTYFAPTYYAQPCYSTYITPVIYSSAYSGFPSCAVAPLVSSSPVAAYAVKKPVTSSVPFRLASQPNQPIQQGTQLQSPVGRYVLAQSPTSALDSAPEELITAADAILAAGGYRQAAQAYAQIVVMHGNSDRLVTRRFIAQVANGDYEQAAVVVELAEANGNQINPGDLPHGDLQLAVGNNNGLIASRSESLAANALQKSDDAVPMLAVAHWLALSGDSERANLFKARAEQMKQVEVGKLISKPILILNDAN